jgi:hypothetical protein
MWPRSAAAAGFLGALALSLFSPSHALAVRPGTYGWSQLASPSGRFLVHYEPGVYESDAEAAAANFDSVYAREVGAWGFPAPRPDGDGVIDVYLTSTGAHLGEAEADDPSAATSSGYALISPANAGNLGTAAHELFHLIQYAIYAHGANFLLEGTAEWAAANVTGTTPWLLSYWSAPEQSLECIPGSACAPAGGQDNSYSRWIFFEHLSERYGPGIVQQVFARAAALRAGTNPSLDLQAIADVLAAHGSSLSAEWNAFVSANAGDAYTLSALAQSHGHPDAVVTSYTGDPSTVLPTDTIGVNHLAAGYVSFLSGDDRSPGAHCRAAALTIQVTAPAGVLAQPVVASRGSVRTFGQHGVVTLPWSTCQGSSALIALPNASTTVDGAIFKLHAQLDLVRATPPRIRLLLGRRVVVARGRRLLRFNVSSSGRGVLRVALDRGRVGKRVTLHKGRNSVRMRLPRGIRAGRHRLIATAYSSAGARGATSRRRLVIAFQRAR